MNSSDTPDLTRSQLFIDDTWIEDSIRVQRTFHQPLKFPEPVIKADRPWERWAVVAYGTVLHRDGRFHFWYKPWTRVDGMMPICYAVSDDGITFEKPSLGLHEHEGSKDNNICLATDGVGLIDNLGVIEDPDDPEWPLKAVYWQRVTGDDTQTGLAAARSTDGMVWDKTPGLVLPGWGDRTNTFATKVDGKFVILGRAPNDPHNPYKCRCVFRVESDDLVHWSEPELIMKPDHEDDANMEIYSVQAFEYESLYLGFIERMHKVPDVLDSELIFSHDSRAWQRTRRRPKFLDWGAPGTWDGAWLSMPSCGPILHRDRLWFYYSGRSAAHAVQYPHNHGAIGVATLRPDGFASMEAKVKEGWLRTPVMVWPAKDLMLNVDCRRDQSGHPRFCDGEVRVEIRDENERPIEGFTRDECQPLCTNTYRAERHAWPVTWGEDRSLRELAGRGLRMVFHLRDAHLYSFAAGDAPAD